MTVTQSYTMKRRRSRTDYNKEIIEEIDKLGIYGCCAKRGFTIDNARAHIRRFNTTKDDGIASLTKPSYPYDYYHRILDSSPWAYAGVPDRIVLEQFGYDQYQTAKRMYGLGLTLAVIGNRFGKSGERARRIIIHGNAHWAKTIPPIVRWFNEKSDLAMLAKMEWPGYNPMEVQPSTEANP